MRALSPLLVTCTVRAVQVWLRDTLGMDSSTRTLSAFERAVAGTPRSELGGGASWARMDALPEPERDKVRAADKVKEKAAALRSALKDPEQRDKLKEKARAPRRRTASAPHAPLCTKPTSAHGGACSVCAVSYTHLTLPTILRV